MSQSGDRVDFGAGTGLANTPEGFGAEFTGAKFGAEFFAARTWTNAFASTLTVEFAIAFATCRRGGNTSGGRTA